MSQSDDGLAWGERHVGGQTRREVRWWGEVWFFGRSVGFVIWRISTTRENIRLVFEDLLVEVLRGQREASASWTLSHGTAAYFRDETSLGPECDSEESDGGPEDDRDALDSLFLPNYEQERRSAFRRTPNRRYCEKRPSVRRNQVRDDYQRRNQVRDDYDGRRRRRARDDRETRTFTRRAAISQILPQPFW